MIALIIALHHGLIMCYGAFFEAQDDFKQIRANKPIGHSDQWWVRVAIASVITGGATHGLVQYQEVSAWIGLPLILTCWPLFSLPFRYALNSLRELPWWYMDDLDTGGNHYDEFWWRLRLVLAGERWRQMTDEEWELLLEAKYADTYEKQVAIMASLFELILFAFCCWWMAQIVNP